ncbi:MAG: EF-hand domain-containing protein [Sphingomicrobium sp.]
MRIGAFLIWQGRAREPETFNALPPPILAATTAGQSLPAIPDAPSADPETKEQKRFARADKNDDGRITFAELVEPLRKPFAKLDVNGDAS